MTEIPEPQSDGNDRAAAQETLREVEITSSILIGSILSPANAISSRPNLFDIIGKPLQDPVPSTIVDMVANQNIHQDIVRQSYKITEIHLPEKVDIEDLSRMITRTEYLQPEGSALTVCILHLDHGGTATGESSTPSMAGYDAEIGKSRALKKAMDKLWELEGYALRKKRYQVRQGTYP